MDADGEMSTKVQTEASLDKCKYLVTACNEHKFRMARFKRTRPAPADPRPPGEHAAQPSRARRAHAPHAAAANADG
jgi:hypothetical protein